MCLLLWQRDRFVFPYLGKLVIGGIGHGGQLCQKCDNDWWLELL